MGAQQAFLVCVGALLHESMQQGHKICNNCNEASSGGHCMSWSAYVRGVTHVVGEQAWLSRLAWRLLQAHTLPAKEQCVCG